MTKEAEKQVEVFSVSRERALAKEGVIGVRKTHGRIIFYEIVRFYAGFGWLTNEELRNLRQEEPRIAP